MGFISHRIKKKKNINVFVNRKFKFNFRFNGCLKTFFIHLPSELFSFIQLEWYKQALK